MSGSAKALRVSKANAKPLPKVALAKLPTLSGASLTLPNCTPMLTSSRLPKLSEIATLRL